MRLSLFFFSVIPSLTFCQGLNLSLANGLAQHKEELLQPIVYKGYVVGIGADYRLKLKNEAILYADLTISGVYTAKTKLNNDLSQLNINLELGYLFENKNEYLISKSTAFNKDGFGDKLGYHWWRNDSHSCYYANGHGGQRVWIIPSQQLVIVHLAEPSTDQTNLTEVADLLDAIMEAM